MTHDAAQIIPLYRRHASAFAKTRSQTLFEKNWLDKFLALLPDTPCVLDIGCGFGAPVGRYLLDQGCELTGIDASPELIAMAQDTLPTGTWQVHDMRTLSLNKTFDGLIAWNSFFHLPPDDQRQMFATFRRHAKPGAALMFTSGTHHGEVIGTFQSAPLYHASLDPDDYRDLLAAQGFDVIDHIAEDPACNTHTVWLTQLSTT